MPVREELTSCVQAANNGVYNQVGSCLQYSQGTTPQIGRISGRAVQQSGPGQIVNRNFSITGSVSSYNSAIRAGAAAWTSSPTAIRYTEGFSASSDDIYVGSYDGGWLGRTIEHPCGGTDFWVGNCTLSWSHVDYNAPNVDQHAQWAQQVSTHELGHALGLGHPFDLSVSSTMQSDLLDPGASLNLTAYDIESVNFNYPNWYFGI